MLSQNLIRTALVGMAFNLLTSPAMSSEVETQAMKKKFADLLAGTFPAPSCADLPGNGEKPQPGSVVITPEGQMRVRAVNLEMFNPGAKFALSATYGPKGFGAALEKIGFDWETKEHMFHLSAKQAVNEVFLEAGYSGGTRNVTQSGVVCSRLDMRTAALAKSGEGARALLTSVFATGPRGLQGKCRPARMPKGKTVEEVTRTVTLILNTDGAVVEGQSLGFDNTRNLPAKVSFGGDFPAQQISATVKWNDGQSVHLERNIQGGSPFSSFAYDLQEGGQRSSMMCRLI